MTRNGVFLAIAGVCCLLAATHAANLNDRPVIGIMAIPCDDCSHNSYIAASYIKYLESGGAQVAPIQYSASDADLLRLLSRVNGFFFTGGGASLDPTSQYFHAVSVIYNFTVQANQQGDYFPLWGTCLGFESICRAQSMDPSILSSFSAENITLPLTFTAAAKSSRLFASTEPGAADAYRMLASEDITMNNHVAGVTPSDFANSDRLNSFFDVLSTNVDINGKEFVSLIEGKTMPIWGSQFHPEKNVYEWWPREVMKHTRDAVFAANYLAEFFVAQTHLNRHSFPSAADRSQALIDNYSPVFTDGEFTQEYYFD